MLEPPERFDRGAEPLLEIPHEIAEEIASWSRTIHQALPENATTLLERAAIEL